jgi:hypothetical protein
MFSFQQDGNDSCAVVVPGFLDQNNSLRCLPSHATG